MKNNLLKLIFSIMLVAVVTKAEPLKLIDFNDSSAMSRIRMNGKSDVEYKIVDTDKGKALEFTCTKGKNGYPGIAISPADGKWDLSAYNRIEFDIENTGKSTYVLDARVDNKGDWRAKPWNTERIHIHPGKKQTLKVYFGYSYGKQGHKLDQANVINLLLFTGRPKKEAHKIRITDIRADGKVGEKRPLPPGATVKVVPKGGLLFGDSLKFDKAQIKDRGTTSKIIENGKAVQANFPATTKTPHPGIYFYAPKQVLWDISSFNQVTVDLENTSKHDVDYMVRVGEKGAVGPNKNKTIKFTFAAGERKEVVIPFVTDEYWDGNAKKKKAHFQTSNIQHIFIFMKNNKKDNSFIFRGAKASSTPAPEMPEWLGKRPPVDGNWTLTFEDNFDGDKIDLTKWNVPNLKESDLNDSIHPNSVKNAGSWWDKRSINTDENVFLKDGNMVMVVDFIKDKSVLDEKLRGRKYSNGLVTSFGKFTQKYGYFESRTKLPDVMGMWPAFWLMPDRGKDAGIWWKRTSTSDGGMEFDIMEHLVRFGKYRYNIAFHWDGYKKDHKAKGSDAYVNPDKDGYITSGLLWEPGKATYYCNGKIVGVWEDERIASVPEYIIYTMPTGGWGTNGYVDEDKLPAYFLTDYVRVWQRDDLKDK